MRNVVNIFHSLLRYFSISCKTEPNKMTEQKGKKTEQNSEKH